MVCQYRCRGFAVLVLYNALIQRIVLGYDSPPPPKCPVFKCPSGEVAVGKPDYAMWTYGCEDSGMSMFGANGFDPSNPMAGLQKPKNVDKCCVERDLCRQTCGMPSIACHEKFEKCKKATCKGDQNCDLQAMLASVMSDPADEDEDPARKYDPDLVHCRAYNRYQKESCTCVKKKEYKPAVERKLKAFYGKFNPEKLDASGEIKDKAEVWKKWGGREPEMFMALGLKYKKKSIQKRSKPKPKPYEPKTKTVSPDIEDEEAPQSPDLDEVDRTPVEDSAGSRFENEKSALETKKNKLADDEDYDAAESVKVQIEELTKSEIKRLNEDKAKAIQDEDYAGAKKIKQRIEKLEL